MLKIWYVTIMATYTDLEGNPLKFGLIKLEIGKQPFLYELDEFGESMELINIPDKCRLTYYDSNRDIVLEGSYEHKKFKLSKHFQDLLGKKSI